MADKELFGNSEQLESSHFADPGKMVGDLISRQAAIEALEETKQSDPFNRYEYQNIGIDWSIDAIKALPSAQLNLSEAYSKAVFTWLMGYQIRAAELKGRYTPYEVLSWVVNDWRKEHERSD